MGMGMGMGMGMPLFIPVVIPMGGMGRHRNSYRYGINLKNQNIQLKFQDFLMTSLSFLWY